MKALIFDIDGTLVNSSRVDAMLFKEAVLDFHPGVRFRSDWSRYRNVTDEGLLAEILGDNGRDASVETMRAVKSRFFDKIRDHVERGPGFESVPGAGSFLERMKRGGHYLAFATGGWRESSVMKLESAGLPFRGIPLFTSDDSPVRTEIMKKALAHAGVPATDVTYFGDATWDREAARELGWRFVAVGKRLKGIENFDRTAILYP